MAALPCGSRLRVPRVSSGPSGGSCGFPPCRGLASGFLAGFATVSHTNLRVRRCRFLAGELAAGFGPLRSGGGIDSFSDEEGALAAALNAAAVQDNATPIFLLHISPTDAETMTSTGVCGNLTCSVSPELLPVPGPLKASACPLTAGSLLWQWFFARRAHPGPRGGPGAFPAGRRRVQRLAVPRGRRNRIARELTCPMLWLRYGCGADCKLRGWVAKVAISPARKWLSTWTVGASAPSATVPLASPDGA